MENRNIKKILKRGIPIVLATTLVFSYGAAETFAKGSKGHKGNKGPKGSHIKIEEKYEKKFGFSDIEGFWGSLTVEKMNALGIIKGYDDGTFQPNKPVTQQEAIVLVVRLLGLESEAIQRNSEGVELPFKNHKSIAVWSRGYIDVALELGIINENEKFQGNKPATRIYIVNVMINALGLDVSKYEDLDLEFSDIAHLSAEEKLQLAVAVSEELAKGSGNKKFNPNKPVTRGEMAAFLERMKEHVDDTIFTAQVKGSLVSVNTTAGSITVKQEVKNATTNQKEWKDVSYSLAEKYVIYYNGKKYPSFEQFKAQDPIEIVLNNENKVIFVQGKSKADDKDDVIWGDLKEVSNFDVTIQSGANLIQYSYDTTKAADVKVTTLIDGQTTTLTGNAAAIAVKTMIDSHFAENTELDVKQLGQALASYVQTNNAQEAQVSVHYTTTQQEINVTVGVNSTTPSTIFTWVKGKVQASFTQTKDATGKIVTHLEFKDTDANKEVRYHKEMSSSVVSSSGHINLDGINITITDSSFESTIAQVLADYKVKFIF